jgi:serine phosphatase RsbU (regulator of sigma subunit)
MENLKGKNTELERQKEYIEKIHLEITDSINYAKRIQSAILPDSNLLSGHFADHFILFKPRNVVSGDFYWFTKVENHIIVTVADCTGHGVPGAFMSMLGMSYLREIVQKEYMTEPSRILYKLRKEIVNTLNQKGIQSEQKDGMDISLISINFSDCDTESDKSFEMQWAGANNPCWIIKNGEFFELKPDKMPIGIHDKMEKFTAQKVTLHSGDLIYLAGDGYKDQFGGPKSKKFMSKRLKELLINSSGGTMDNQKAILEKAIDEWQNGYEIKHEQTDDITILGIRI